jgi:hypothetical protein
MLQCAFVEVYKKPDNSAVSNVSAETFDTATISKDDFRKKLHLTVELCNYSGCEEVKIDKKIMHFSFKPSRDTMKHS